MQSAFNAKHSTETALVKIKNDILFHLDSRKGICLVLLDRSVALTPLIMPY